MSAGAHHTAVAWQDSNAEHAILVWGVNLDGQAGNPPTASHGVTSFVSPQWKPGPAELFHGHRVALPRLGPWHPSVHLDRADPELLAATVAFVAATADSIPTAIVEEVIAALATYHGFKGS